MGFLGTEASWFAVNDINFILTLCTVESLIFINITFYAYFSLTIFSLAPVIAYSNQGVGFDDSPIILM